jgi:hypothetical protein
MLPVFEMLPLLQAIWTIEGALKIDGLLTHFPTERVFQSKGK